MKKLTLTSALSGLIWLSLPSMAHIEQSEPYQSLRQSYFALLGMTFAPMGDMVKGKIEWDDDRFSSWANDLHHVAQVGVHQDVVRSLELHEGLVSVLVVAGSLPLVRM